MNKYFKGLIAAAISYFVISPVMAFAAAPSFGSCTSPSGTQIAGFDEGDHGILGNGLQSGSDHVYTDANGAQQCFCSGSSGTQTNWWRISESMSLEEIGDYVTQGWTYVPDGSAWGLESAPYLARNVTYSCSGGTGGGGSTNNGGGSNGGGGGSVQGASTCSDQAPAGAPVLLSVISNGPNSVTLNWQEAAGPVSYYLVAYGTDPNNFTYGNPNVGGAGTTSYTVNQLSGGVTYYFRVRAGNGCTPGPYSQVRTVQPTGGVVSGPATGFEPGVLGITTVETEATPSGEVQGVATGEVAGAATNCGSCIWWPILAGEAVLLVLLYYVAHQNLTRKRWIGGAVIAVVAFIIWWLLNRGGCSTGGMNLILFVLACKWFFLLDALVLIILTLTMGQPTAKKKAKVQVKTESVK